jgi:hypothetical protein
MLCLRRSAIYMLWSVCRAASRLRHLTASLTASFDSFGGTQIRVGAPDQKTRGPQHKGVRRRTRSPVVSSELGCDLRLGDGSRLTLQLMGPTNSDW